MKMAQSGKQETDAVRAMGQTDSSKTKKRYGWEPKEIGLLQDIHQYYGEAKSAW